MPHLARLRRHPEHQPDQRRVQQIMVPSPARLASVAAAASPAMIVCTRDPSRRPHPSISHATVSGIVFPGAASSIASAICTTVRPSC
jgi:hypothetical protein